MAELGKLVYEPDDRLGARQSQGVLSFEFSLCKRIRREGSRRAYGAVSLHRWAHFAGYAAHRLDRRPTRGTAQRRERVYGAGPRAATAESLGGFLRASAALSDSVRIFRARGSGHCGWRG